MKNRVVIDELYPVAGLNGKEGRPHAVFSDIDLLHARHPQHRALPISREKSNRDWKTLDRGIDLEQSLVLHAHGPGNFGRCCRGYSYDARYRGEQPSQRKHEFYRARHFSSFEFLPNKSCCYRQRVRLD